MLGAPAEQPRGPAPCIMHGRPSLFRKAITAAQACAECEDERVPAWLREEWRLVDEQVLVEGRVSLLKLAARLDELCPLSCGRGPGCHAHPAAQAKVVAAPLTTVKRFVVAIRATLGRRLPLDRLCMRFLRGFAGCSRTDVSGSLASQGSQGSLEGLTGQVQELQERLRSCTQQATCCQPVQSAPMEEGQQASPSAVAADSGSAMGKQQAAPADGQGQGDLGNADRLAQTAGDWQLSPESRADGQSFSLVFVNPRALFNALGRYVHTTLALAPTCTRSSVCALASRRRCTTMWCAQPLQEQALSCAGTASLWRAV